MQAMQKFLPDSRMSMEMSRGELLYQDIYLLQKMAEANIEGLGHFWWHQNSDFGQMGMISELRNSETYEFTLQPQVYVYLIKGRLYY